MREKIKEDLASRTVFVRDWLKIERERILSKAIYEPLLTMCRDNMKISSDWALEFPEFWSLPNDFCF